MEAPEENSPSGKAPISHTGVVESYENGTARVKIYHGGDCGLCPAKGGCASASFGEDGQTIDIRHPGVLSPGQRVTVVLRSRTDFLAIILAFGVPIVLMVAVLLCLVGYGASQVAAGLSSIGTVVLYLAVLALFRKQLQKKFELTIVA